MLSFAPLSWAPISVNQVPASAPSGATGIAVAIAPKPTAAAVGKIGILGSAVATAPKPTAAASGRVGVTGSASATVARPTASGAGKAGVTGAASATASKPIASASGKVGIIGTIAATAPKPTAAASGKVGVIGSVVATAPKPISAVAGKSGVTGTVVTTAPKPVAAVVGKSGVLGTISAVAAKPTGSASGNVTVMATGTAGLISRRFADAARRRGRQIVLRHVTKAGPLGPNPPAIQGAVLDGAVAAGVSVISIRATAALGRILAGDLITIGTLPPVAVASDALSVAPGVDPAVLWQPGFVAIQLAGTLPAAVADGTPITFTWQADTPVWCGVNAFDFSLQSNEIIAGDEIVVIAAYGVPRPSITDVLIFDGQNRTIVSVTPVYQRALIAAWRVHAR